MCVCFKSSKETQRTVWTAFKWCFLTTSKNITHCQSQPAVYGMTLHSAFNFVALNQLLMSLKHFSFQLLAFILIGPLAITWIQAQEVGSRTSWNRDKNTTRKLPHLCLIKCEVINPGLLKQTTKRILQESDAKHALQTTYQVGYIWEKMLFKKTILKTWDLPVNYLCLYFVFQKWFKKKAINISSFTVMDNVCS